MGAFDVDIGPMDDGNDTTRRAGTGICFDHISPFASSATPAFVSPSLYDPSLQPAQSSKQETSRLSVPDKQPPVKSAFVWKLNDVPTLPELFRLERTAVFIEGSSPSQITERISKVLWERSIEAEYEDEKAKAKCTTPEGVECRVRLYRGRGKYNHGIIVEVQRRFGNSVNFHEHVSAILNAARGMAPPPPPPALGVTGDSLPLVSDSEDDYSPASGAESLKMVEKMFAHGRYDSQYLALQTLSSLTSVSKMGPATAKTVSTELLSSSNEVVHNVFDILSKKEDHEGFTLRSLSLSILANALEATNGKLDNVFREHIRPILLKELKNAESTPRTAHMAARCFEFLYKADHDRGEIAAALEEAQSVGAARHAGLYQQAQRCLAKML